MYYRSIITKLILRISIKYNNDSGYRCYDNNTTSEIRKHNNSKVVI